MHMDTENEYGVYGSGVTDLANACPEFDVIVGGHGHRSIPNMMINNVLVVENKNAGATLAAAVQLMGMGKAKRPLCVFAGRRTYE